MTKKNKLPLFLLLTLLFASCTSKEVVREQEIILRAQTRSDSSPTGYVSMQTGDQVGAYIVANPGEATNGSLKPVGNLFDNLQLSYQLGVLKPQGQIYYPAGVSHVDYYAYAPYNAGATISSAHSMAFLVQKDQSSSDALKKSDLLWSKLLKAATASSALPSLMFEHSLSKLIFKLKPGIGVTLPEPALKITGTKIGIDLNVSDGTLSNVQGNAQEITPLVQENKTEFEAITVPQTVNKDTKLFSVTNNGKTYDYIMKADKVLESGKKYTYEITINANDLEVQVDGSIKDWNDGGTVTEDIS